MIPLTRRLCLLVTTCSLLLIPIAGYAGFMIADRQNISIAAVSNKERSREQGENYLYENGVYVAYKRQNIIHFLTPSDDPEHSYRGLHGFQQKMEYPFNSPAAIAENSGILYVWSDVERKLIAFDPYYGSRRTILSDRAIRSVDSIVVSPDKLIFLLDKARNRIYWLRDNGGENLQPEPAYEIAEETVPVSLVFLAWDTLAVLDGRTNSVRIFGLGVGRERLYLKPLDTLRVNRRGVGERFTSITAQDGTLYLSDGSRVYNYVFDTGELIPASSEGDFDHIQGIAASYETLFVVDRDELKVIPKTATVEIDLQAAPEINQIALLRLYLYLDSKALLPTQSVKAVKNYSTLSEFLKEKGILLLDTDLSRETTTSWWGKQTTTVDREKATIQQLFSYWMCRNNKSLCEENRSALILFSELAGNTVLTVPDLNIQTRLKKATIDIEDSSVRKQLDRLIPDRKQRQRVSFATLQKLNPELGDISEDAFYEMDSGSVVLARQTWSLTANVPISDYDNRDSRLYQITGHEAIYLYGLELISRKTANSHTSGELAGDCLTIHQKHDELFRLIRYPEKAWTRPEENSLQEYNGPIGIVERAPTDSGYNKHSIFYRSDKPAWYVVGDLDELLPESQPESLDTSDEKTGDYVRELHHATHVSALIGGRSSKCWSGLLPGSRLVMADSSSGKFRGNIKDAIDAGVKVFNISQSLGTISDGSQNSADSFTFFTQTHNNILFVTSAGQSDGRFISAQSFHPYPAGWGNLANIITVTSTFEQAHRGKQFIDLISEGSNILSATNNSNYSLATGTSQSAPLVTAAAAYLATEEGGGYSPGEVKARLIATADWDNIYRDRVWGGRLDFGDAVQFYNRDIFRASAALPKDGIYEIVKPDHQHLLHVSNEADARYYMRSGPDIAIDNLRIRQEDILSLRKNRCDGCTSTHRVVFKDKSTQQVRIIPNALIEGKLEFRGAKLFDYGSRNFRNKGDTDYFYPGGIDISDIEEYFRGLPYKVKWKGNE